MEIINSFTNVLSLRPSAPSLDDIESTTKPSAPELKNLPSAENVTQTVDLVVKSSLQNRTPIDDPRQADRAFWERVGRFSPWDDDALSWLVLAVCIASFGVLLLLVMGIAAYGQYRAAQLAVTPEPEAKVNDRKTQ